MTKDSEKGKYFSPEGSRTWQYFAAATCAIGNFNVGTHVGWNAPTLMELTSPNSRIPITMQEISSLAASLSIGMMLAPLFSVFTVDSIGRRKTILLCGIPGTISWMFLAVATKAIVLIVARVIAGISMGMAMYTLSIYQGEVLSVTLRGALGAVNSLAYYSGIFFVSILSPSIGIQRMAATCCVLALVLTIAIWFVPESPYFFLMHQKVDEAERALEKLLGKMDVKDELELIAITIQEKGKSILKTSVPEKSCENEPNSFKKLFTIRGNVKSFVISLNLTLLSHFCGLASIVSYGPVIFKAMGVQLDPYRISTIFALLQMLTSLVPIFVVEKFGRRVLLFTSSSLMSIFLLIIATFFYLMEYTDFNVKKYEIVALCTIAMFTMAVNLGIGPIPGIINSEIFAPDIKALSTCILSILGGLMGAVCAKFYLLLATTWGLGHCVPFYIYALVTLSTTAMLSKVLPETRGKTLLEIQRELNS